jgi:site-specific recombinase XerD
MSKEEILAKLQSDLEARGRSQVTCEEYGEKVRAFQDYFNRPASEMGEQEIIEFQRHLSVGKGLMASTVNTYNSALRFVYGVTLDRNLNYKKIPMLPRTRRIPQLFTKEEVAKILDSAESLTHKALLMLAYGSGLRLSEVTGLKPSDIESDQMRILVRHGKGDRDRYAMLPQKTLEVLREYWLEQRPKEWLFEAPKCGGQYKIRTVQDAFHAARKRSGVKKYGTFHTLRHCFATHLYEDSQNLLALKKLLGHVRIDTTAWYTQLAYSQYLGLQSPLDTLETDKNA